MLVDLVKALADGLFRLLRGLAAFLAQFIAHTVRLVFFLSPFLLAACFAYSFYGVRYAAVVIACTVGLLVLGAGWRDEADKRYDVYSVATVAVIVIIDAVLILNLVATPRRLVQERLSVFGLPNQYLSDDEERQYLRNLDEAWHAGNNAGMLSALNNLATARAPESISLASEIERKYLTFIGAKTPPLDDSIRLVVAAVNVIAKTAAPNSCALIKYANLTSNDVVRAAVRAAENNACRSPIFGYF